MGGQGLARRRSVPASRASPHLAVNSPSRVLHSTKAIRFRIAFGEVCLVRILLALLLFQEREPGGGVFGDLVAGGKCVDRSFLGLAGKEVQGDALAALEFLFPLVEK